MAFNSSLNLDQDPCAIIACVNSEGALETLSRLADHLAKLTP